MVIEIFPNMASNDTFWEEDWAAIDAETVDTPKFQERFERLESTGPEFLGTVFAREVRLGSSAGCGNRICTLRG